MTEKDKKTKIEENKETKQEEKKQELKTEKKNEDKKPTKTEVIARGLNLHASKKHLMYISRFIKNKTIDSAIQDLEEVIKLKKPIPFKGEIPHRKGMMSGRYPINASKLVISVLKGLKGNALSSGMDLDKTKIYFASANRASRPPKRGGRRFKRANILIKAKLIENSTENKNFGENK
ncbi:MAG: hypothetical protein N3D20_00150 [Candidatus Pacearchaeota archaeon]|nr:hypothetical protein [Candidatus Pacearchaeota archaeon]